MKITKRQLRRIIKEEKSKIIFEAASKTDTDTIEEIIEELGAAVKMHTSQAERLQSILERLVKEQVKEE
jgi:predicted house-cleaning noncanonical NTP pyrophosphatase (MazG superfamily)